MSRLPERDRLPWWEPIARSPWLTAGLLLVWFLLPCTVIWGGLR